MCGIVGFATRSDQPSTSMLERLPAALAKLRHRGPDAQGWAQYGTAVFGHLRLSILDLSDLGRQPMETADGRFAITYNGEVYNFRELAREHRLEGLRSASDTEVVLALFAKLGVASLAQLNGMFAFAVCDRRARKLWLVRDRLGIKPLYYRLNGCELQFASEIKGILALDGGAAACNISALHEWLYFGNPLGTRTLYDGIQQLAPGCCLQIDLESFASSVQPYWSLAEVTATAPRQSPGAATAAQDTRRLLEQAVKRQLVSDVPVGVFLSGGVDSSAIAAFASKHYEGKLSTYSVGFDFAGATDELPRAKRVAARFGTEHHEIQINGADIGGLVEQLVHHHDMPFADAANIPLSLMASRISAHTKVVLQGDGGDELFGGYSRYFTLAHARLLRVAARAVQSFQGLAPESAFNYRARRFLRAVSADDLATTIALLLTPEDRSLAPDAIFAEPARSAVLRSDPFARHRECLQRFSTSDRVNLMSFMDLVITLPDTFLEKVDRSTMAASLEVRVPFLDNDLVDYAVRLPGKLKAPSGKKKWLLKAALHGVVPDEVLHGRKQGLEVPYGRWLQGALRPLFFDHMATFRERHPGVLDTAQVTRLFERTGAGRRDDSYMLWKVLNFMIWANHSKLEFNWQEAA